MRLGDVRRGSADRRCASLSGGLDLAARVPYASHECSLCICMQAASRVGCSTRIGDGNARLKLHTRFAE